jgi:hypothetical protein
VVFVLIVVVESINVLNGWPLLARTLSTAQPLALQTGAILTTSLVFRVFTGAALGLVAGLVVSRAGAPLRLPPGQTVAIGASLGLALAGTVALARQAAPSLGPLWGDLSGASAFVPFLAGALAPVTIYLIQTLLLLTVLYALGRRTRPAWIWVLVGIALAGSSSIETIPSWLLIGTATGVVLMAAYRAVLRHQGELLMLMTAMQVVLSTIREGELGMYPSALAGSLAGAVLVAITAWIWFRGTIKKHA